MVVAKNWGKRVMRSYYVMGIEFQFCEMKSVLEMEGSDGCTTI